MSARVTDIRAPINGFVIERGVPIPSPYRTAWPFDKMEAGESFAVSADRRLALRSAVRSFHKRNPGKQLTVRVIDNKRRVRCWRIK